LAPVVAAHRAALEQDRRLPDALYDAIANAGLLRLWLPHALGGPELSPHDFMDVVEAAAALDGSVGWIIGNGAGMSRVGGYVAESVARDWFADARTFIASATGGVGDAVPVSGGYHVTGRWPYASGIHHATHAMALCRLADGRPGDAAPDLLWCYVPRANFAIVDNWHVSGLRGTGSCDFTVSDAFVPAAHAHSFPLFTPSQPGIVYRLSPYSVLSWTVAVVPLGIARAAMDAFMDIASGRVRFGTAQALRERETVQAMYGRAQSQFSAARLFLADAMSDLMTAIDRGEAAYMAARARFRMACAHAGEAACAIVEMLCAATGSFAILESHALERCQRDVQATARHIAMSPNNYILGGRLGLGLDAGTTRF
jgi:alkylation response protein AidB-like acyl-CoA dehydrogenase